MWEVLVTYSISATKMFSDFNRECFELFCPVAPAFENEVGRVIKRPVKCAEKIVVFIEERSPLVGRYVNGKNDCVRIFLCVPAVNDIKEQTGIRLIKFSPFDLIDDKRGRFDQPVDQRSYMFVPFCCRECKSSFWKPGITSRIKFCENEFRE